MTRTLTAAILLACATGSLHAAAPFAPDLATLPAVPRVELPAAAVQKALDEAVKGRPYQYAVPVPLTLAPAQGLRLARGDGASWRLRLHSPGAQSLSLQLEQATLPAGAQLWTYDSRARLVHGPYGAASIGRSGLWTAPVAGEELVVEIRMPEAQAGALKLGTARAFHGFRDWKDTATPKAGAGSCNVDITCASAEPWREDAGAVARISIGGSFLCSGQLLNNVRQDEKRLFLTANHCGIDGESGPAESVVFYFNYTGPCGNNVTEPLPPPTFQGAQRLAHDVQADFALLLITDPQPMPAGAYFAGWDARGGDPPMGGAAIHHASGDEKKIALHDVVPARSTVEIGTGCAIETWQVQWTTGTTEGGSSGGGLWDSSHRLIGILSGGAASCANPNGFDYFARLERGWTAGPAPEGQLRHWLDPDATCIASVPGLDPDDASPQPLDTSEANRRCMGEVSLCAGGRRSGGALHLMTALLLALGIAARRRRSRLQHHQHDARDRDP